jgi:thiamine kinase-like enzyme
MGIDIPACDDSPLEHALLPAWAKSQPDASYSPCSPAEGATDEERVRTILRTDCAFTLENMSNGFCNTVYLVKHSPVGSAEAGTPVVVKLYSELAKSRVDFKTRGVVDIAAANAGLTAMVYKSLPDGIVHEFIPGRVLSEMDIHGGCDSAVIDNIARKLAQLHYLPIPKEFSGTALSWVFMGRMMTRIKASSQSLPEWVTVSQIESHIDFVRKALDAADAPVVLCHGDFKPSNIMLTNESSCDVMLIDFELAGPNYRGFDLMKLFRTNLSEDTERLKQFAQQYVLATDLGEDPAALIHEMKLFEPLTWLEAAVFFFLVLCDVSDSPKWVDLAKDRWDRYLKSRHLLTQSG